MECFPAIKKNEIMSFAGKKWMEVEIILLSKINQVQKAKYHIFSVYAESRPKMVMIVMINNHDCL
jgi:hypothetical protein